MNLPRLIPEPYRLAARLAMIALVVIAIYATGRQHGADHVRGQWDAEKGRTLAAQLVAEQTARAREQSMIQQIRKAENDANDREEKRRAAAAAAADTGTRLQLALNTIRHGLPAASPDACRATADTAIAVFGECAAEAGSLADKAGGHASDVQTLSESWPK
jgi:hypothetical protein